MNPEIKKALVMLAAYYEKVLSPEQIEIYSNQLAESLTAEETLQACKMYINEPANEFFPRPLSKLIHLIKKPVSNEDQATNLASKILQAVIDHGYRWNVGSWRNTTLDGVTDIRKTFQGSDQLYLQWDHAALSVFGPLGIIIIDRFGGWESFCELVRNSPDGVIRAQIKTLALSLMNTNDKTGSFEIPLISSGPVKGLENLIQLANIKTIKE
jgi:hypothetical protein